MHKKYQLVENRLVPGERVGRDRVGIWDQQKRAVI